MGLIASIYHSPLGNCSNNGISAKFDKCCIVNAEGPFNPDDKTPAVLIVKGATPGHVIIVPAVVEDDNLETWCPAPGWLMMGGDFVHTSDSRFGEAVRRVYLEAWGNHPGAASEHMILRGAIALHDRKE